jgi:hypothetical protein
MRKKSEKLCAVCHGGEMCSGCVPGSTYLLRKAPDELMSLARHIAIDQGMSLRALIIQALWKYVEEACQETRP